MLKTTKYLVISLTFVKYINNISRKKNFLTKIPGDQNKKKPD